ncbi:MAG: RnfABCDGE type electron transport complex subunit B [Oscillospiraceae bacterium]|nr:RnfABCDGE type electron transport complex subunit B [Oscillospiraceae bacterium]
MNTIIIAIVSVTVIGLVCSVLLSVVSKLMHVEVDERVILVRSLLPGANCGACGYSGCDRYAAALVEGAAQPNICTPGGADLAKQLSSIMGLEDGGVVRRMAMVHCLGDTETKRAKMEYTGMNTCRAVKLHFGGQNACAFGCVGFGDCLKVCPSDAICIEKGLAHIRPRQCSGCGLCVKACPYDLISVENASVAVAVLCKNTEKGAVLKDKCQVGCIGCMKCVKECPADAIQANDFLAVIDYAQCTGCGKCVSVCVKKCIIGF